LDGLSGIFPPELTRPLLVGVDAPDDAAVYELGGLRLIMTADYFPPVVDDAYEYGAIAAANALSDVFAMGGRPLLALNLATFPEDMPPSLQAAILRGGAEKVREAGAVVGGGHTTRGDEPNFGLAVLGVVEGELIRKGGARPGDALYLTKALGTGVITTAGKAGKARDADLRAAVASMMTLNRDASLAARQAGVRSGTDVTGFSLLGHGLEMAEASRVCLRISASAVPFLPGARDYGTYPGGTKNNERYFNDRVRFAPQVDETTRHLLFSPETAGGLLLAVPAGQGLPLGVRIGEVAPGEGIEVIP